VAVRPSSERIAGIGLPNRFSRAPFTAASDVRLVKDDIPGDEGQNGYEPKSSQMS